MTSIKTVLGDITAKHYAVAIVNAANESLLGGGGVDGCIRRVTKYLDYKVLVQILLDTELHLNMLDAAEKKSGVKLHFIVDDSGNIWSRERGRDKLA